MNLNIISSLEASFSTFSDILFNFLSFALMNDFLMILVLTESEVRRVVPLSGSLDNLIEIVTMYKI